MTADWPYLGRLVPRGAPSGDLAPERPREQVLAATPERRRTLLESYLRARITEILQLAPDMFHPDKPIREFGFDSLMAVQIRNRIEADLGVAVSTRKILEDGTSTASLLSPLLDAIDGADTDAEHARITTALSGSTFLDLDHEHLPDDIRPEPDATPYEQGEPEHIFVTGVTGFLGAFLLDTLLKQTRAKIYCHARAGDTHAARARILRNLAHYQVAPDPERAGRIVPLAGDLSRPSLGLGEKKFDELCDTIDFIYNNAAMLNFVKPYSEHRPANVGGTADVLRMACRRKLKPVHHVSSIAVYLLIHNTRHQIIFEGEPLTRSEELFYGYGQSKWVSERFVWEAHARGLPVAVYRPGLITGHSVTGAYHSDDFLGRMIRGCVELGSFPDVQMLTQCAPVDYVARLIVHLSRLPESVGGAFHCTNPDKLMLSEILDFARTRGFDIQRRSLPDWLAELRQATTVSQDNSLFPILPFITEQVAPGALSPLEHLEQRPYIDSSATRARVRDPDLVCPPMDARLLDTYYDYLIQSGYLPGTRRASVAPDEQAETSPVPLASPTAAK
jgi:thioester reductase-like protein